MKFPNNFVVLIGFCFVGYLACGVSDQADPPPNHSHPTVTVGSLNPSLHASSGGEGGSGIGGDMSSSTGAGDLDAGLEDGGIDCDLDPCNCECDAGCDDDRHKHQSGRGHDSHGKGYGYGHDECTKDDE